MWARNLCHISMAIPPFSKVTLFEIFSIDWFFFFAKHLSGIHSADYPNRFKLNFLSLVGAPGRTANFPAEDHGLWF